MAFSSDGDTWDDWEPYSENKTYILSAGDGLKTVYFIVKDKVGNTAAPVFDTIKLDTTEDNESTPSGPDDPEPKKEEDTSTSLIIMGSVVVIVVIIIILIIFLLLKRKKKEKIELETKTAEEVGEEAPQSSEPDQTTEPPDQSVSAQATDLDIAQESEEKLCSSCGLTMSYDKDTDSYYCGYCDKLDDD